MSSLFVPLLALLALAAEPLSSGDQNRSVKVGEEVRPYRVHVPASYDAKNATPLVLALHPFAMDGAMMARISGMSETADRDGFLVAYPNGKGWGSILHWNAGQEDGKGADDVAYITKVIDDVSAVANIDPKRIYATGFSNGGMMCYRLASELSDRIAAIAPVGGTRIDSAIQAKRPVSVMHFHGTEDKFVSYDGRLWRNPGGIRLQGVEETVQAWVKRDGCPEESVTTEIARKADDGLSIEQFVYGPGRDGSEVVLYKIKGGGHTWPGRKQVGEFLGKAALDLKADDLMWEFFRKHPMP